MYNQDVIEINPKTNRNDQIPSPNTNASSNQDSKSIKDRWVCKRCTYFNSNSESKCILCATSRELFDDDSNRQEIDAFLNLIY